MAGFVLFLGGLIVAASLVLITSPQRFTGILDGVFGSRWIYAAALARLLIGAALIASAQAVRFPDAIAAIGWLSVVGGLALVVIPGTAMARMTAWFSGLPTGVMRLWLVLALLLGKIQQTLQHRGDGDDEIRVVLINVVQE